MGSWLSTPCFQCSVAKKGTFCATMTERGCGELLAQQNNSFKRKPAASHLKLGWAAFADQPLPQQAILSYYTGAPLSPSPEEP